VEADETRCDVAKGRTAVWGGVEFEINERDLRSRPPRFYDLTRGYCRLKIQTL
jgi:hypothetical protein